MKEIKIDSDRFLWVHLREVLRAFSPLFTPPLSQSVDLEVYSKKLSEKATFVTCQDQGVIRGMIAYYENKQQSQVYVTLICVERVYQSQGVGSMMLNYLVNNIDDAFETIALEVNSKNDKAIKFYTKHGFIKTEDRGEKFLMEKRL